MLDYQQLLSRELVFFLSSQVVDLKLWGSEVVRV